MSRISVSLSTLALALLVAAPAAAQTPDEAAAVAGDQGYYLGPGTDIAESGVSDLVRDAANLGGLRLRIVVLDSEPAGGATTFAGAVLDRLGTGTVLVLTEDGFVGYDSDEVDRSAMESALDAADAAGGDDLTYLRNTVSALVGAPVPAGGDQPASEPAAASEDGGGGGAGLLLLLVIVGGLVLLVVFAVRRSRGSAKGELARARSEMQSQLDAMANDILDLADRVRLGDAEARRHFEAGSAAYSAATEQFEKAESLAQLEGLAPTLDEAAWQLDAAKALLEGEPVPPKPEKESARCFFDPTHRGPMEQATIKTSAGDRTVMVCKTDAEKLRRGEQPDPRMIDVGGRRIPAARAPRSHGGLGMSGADLLAILVGGVSQALPDMLGRRRRGGGLLRGRFPTSPRRATRRDELELPSPSRRGSMPRPSRRWRESTRSGEGRMRGRGGRRRRR